MAAFSSVKRRVATVVVMALGTLGATGLTPGWRGPQQGSAPTPLQLFQKMLPVIKHDRCSNCHGGVDPFSGRDHEGGMIDTVPTSPHFEPCTKCHKTEKGWGLPSKDHFFVGKTDQDLCALFAEFAMKQGHARFISNHLMGDDLVIAAFAGWMGGARDPKAGDSADPPPMSQAAFVQLGRDWVTLGQGACEVLGTIYREESVASADTTHPDPTSDLTIQQTGTRTVNITLRGGQYHADIKTNGQIVTTLVQHLTNASGRPCIYTVIDSTEYSGSTTDLARVAIKDTIFFADTSPPQTDYRIDVDLPPESTSRTTQYTVMDLCKTRIPPPDNSAEKFDWPEVHFTLEGHVEDPRTDGRAGACDKMIKYKDVGSEKVEADRSHPCNRFVIMGNADTPGLMDHGALIAYHDGSDIEFRVVSRWNLKFK